MNVRPCLAVAIVLALAASAAFAQPAPPTLAPLVNIEAKDRIPDQYIVVFKKGTPRESIAAAEAVARKNDGTVLFVYGSALAGFSAKLPPKALAAVRALPDVAYVEADQKVTTQTMQPPNPPGAPPTGLDRIDRRLLPLNGTYTYSETGNGVNAYVIDTGIRTTNTDFGGRASGAFTSIMDGNGTNDCHGHGTNVAGILGSTTFGVAKQVALHAVRVLNCAGTGTIAGVIAGVDFVTANAVHPAVANMSLGGGASPAEDASVNNLIASGVIVVVAAGNNGADACGFSPARVPNAITVGNIDPSNDTRNITSNFGTCVDLFAPGTNILSTGNANDTATSVFTGTSQASPHVAGVAARFLETHPGANQAAVQAAIHAADDVFGVTPFWPGITNPGAGSPNELLHYGSLNDGTNDGDPHLTTVDGVHYDFQGAGEFVSLRDGSGLEIQTRQTPVPMSSVPGPSSYTGLATCVSLNTAVAARVGSRRVTYQPNIAGVPDPSGMQLRVDGTLTPLGASGIDLGADGRISKLGNDGSIEIDFPDGTVMQAIPAWWPTQSKWYMNVHVANTRASEGILGPIASGSWLPALPDGSAVGPKPGPAHERYVDLYQKFGDAWRVTNATSLFDYAPGTSTATFTVASWPTESGPCTIPQSPPVHPLAAAVAKDACHEITGKDMNADCTFDVMFTGERGIAKTYLATQRLRAGSTRVSVIDDVDPTQPGEWVTFTATVARLAPGGPAPQGMAQFTLDGANVGAPVALDELGRARWETARLKVGLHQVSATYIPGAGSPYFTSTSADQPHTVQRCFCEQEMAGAMSR
jgi:subtilisin family serine protease